MEGKIKIGPVGSDTHRSKTWDEGSHNGIIYQIFLSHGPAGILSIQFQFLMDGKLVLSGLHGQKTGYMFNVITLDYPHEYITGISGTHTTACSDTLHIKSLKFITNTKEYGPFGSSISIPAKNLGCKQEKFEFKLGNFLCQFGGFFGTYDASGIQCLGLYLQPTTIIPKTGTSDSEDTESKYSIVS